MFSLLLGRCLGVESLDNRVNVHLALQGTVLPNSSARWFYAFLIPPTTSNVPVASRTCQNLMSSVFLIFSYSSGIEMTSLDKRKKKRNDISLCFF